MTLQNSSPLDGPVLVTGARKAAPGRASHTPAEAGNDGRRLRGLRNREAVVDAILALLEEGGGTPSAAQIAERAGVSLRSVFRHFDDLDALFLAAIGRQAERTLHFYNPPKATGSTADRVAALVTQRRKLHEAVAPVRRAWIRRYDQHPTVKPVLANVRAGLRAQIESLFAADLADLPMAERRSVVDAIDVATCFHAWDFLRFESGYTVARTSAAVRRSVTAVLRDAGITV